MLNLDENGVLADGFGLTFHRICVSFILLLTKPIGSYFHLFYMKA